MSVLNPTRREQMENLDRAMREDREDKLAMLSINALTVAGNYFRLVSMMREYFLAHQDYECPEEIKKALNL